MKQRRFLCILCCSCLLAALLAGCTLAGKEKPSDSFRLPAGCSEYGRRQLSDLEARAYDQILPALFEGKTTVFLPQLGEENLRRVMVALFADLPVVSWVGNEYSFASLAGRTVLWLSYELDREEIAERLIELDQAAEDFAGDIDPSLPAFDQAHLIYDRLAEEVAYDLDAPRTNELAGALLDRRATCKGIAQAYQYLLERRGIETLMVYGETSQPHAWNIVRLEGVYYLADPTWGNGQVADGPRYVNHEYLLQDEERFSATHTPFDEGENYPLPECFSRAQNYFVRTGTLVSEGDGEQAACTLEEALASAAQQNAAHGGKTLQIAFADPTLASHLMETRIQTGDADQLARELAERQGYRVLGRTYSETTQTLSYLLE